VATFASRAISCNRRASQTVCVSGFWTKQAFPIFIAIAAAGACVWSGVETVTASILSPSLSSNSRKSWNRSASLKPDREPPFLESSRVDVADGDDVPVLGSIGRVAAPLAADADAGVLHAIVRGAGLFGTPGEPVSGPGSRPDGGGRLDEITASGLARHRFSFRLRR
jgi:hypothetical protein